MRHSFYMNDSTAGLLTALRDHYHNEHGLNLSTNAVLRRCIYELHRALSLPGTPTDAEGGHITVCTRAPLKGETPTRPALEELADLVARFSGPGHPASTKKSNALVDQLAKDGVPPNEGTSTPERLLQEAARWRDASIDHIATLQQRLTELEDTTRFLERRLFEQMERTRNVPAPSCSPFKQLPKGS